MRPKNNDHGPIEDAIRSQMTRIGQMIGNALPLGWGFALLTYRHNDPGRMNYMSNSKREDMITALEELVAKMKADV